MEEIAGSVYVGVFAIFALDHGVAVLEVTGVPVMLDIRGSAIVFNMNVAAAGQPGSTATLLEVAAPRIALPVHRTPIREDMEPPLLRMDRSDALVESERSDMARFISGSSIGSDVVRARGITNWSEPGFMELQNLVESPPICRPALIDVVGCVFGNLVFPPPIFHQLAGRLILQP